MFDQLRIRPLLAEHPIQPHRQPPPHHHLGHGFIALAYPQTFVGPLQLGILLHRRLPGFPQQKPHQTRPLLADVSQPLLAARAVLRRHQPQIGAHRSRRVKAAHLAQRQHRGPRRPRPPPPRPPPPPPPPPRPPPLRPPPPPPPPGKCPPRRAVSSDFVSPASSSR